MSLIGCTISGNHSYGLGLGGGIANLGTATLVDTIVANNSKAAGPSDIDNEGTLTGSYNLIGIGGAGGLTSGNNHNIVLSSLSGLGLAPLGYYGGPTETMALLPGSAAIGKGSSSVDGANIPSTDQRGFSLSSPVDIGAFQTGHGLVVNTTSDGTSSPAGKLSLRQALNIANVPDPADSGGVRVDHVRLKRVRLGADDHAFGRRIGAIEHQRIGVDHRPCGRRDHQRRRQKRTLPGCRRSHGVVLEPDDHERQRGRQRQRRGHQQPGHDVAC